MRTQNRVRGNPAVSAENTQAPPSKAPEKTVGDMTDVTPAPEQTPHYPLLDLDDAVMKTNALMVLIWGTLPLNRSDELPYSDAEVFEAGVAKLIDMTTEQLANARDAIFEERANYARKIAALERLITDKTKNE